MSKYLLRAEAVNLGNFVYDTHNIKAIRGGGFMLLSAVENLKKTKGLSTVFTGASIGLFTFDAEDNERAQSMADNVLETLNEKTKGHATFVVDWIKTDGNFKEELETLTAMNRWKQFQQPTVIVPEISTTTSDPCFLDGIRPGTTDGKLPDEHKKKQVSDSVAFRIDKGLILRNEIYGEILKSEQLDLKFTDSLEDLSKNESKGNLDRKIAFIYIDGNRFTKVRGEKCDSSEKLGDFSDKLKKKQSEFIRQLVKKAQSEKDFKYKDKLQIEILLWGGDEIEIVVPAWKGWETLSLFYQTMKDAEYDDMQLTHAAGIIFCHHNAPILNIRRLAHDLADKVKDTVPKDIEGISHEKHDAFRSIVLESFDNIGGDLDSFTERYYKGADPGDMVMTAAEMKEFSDLISSMKAGFFPRNKLHEIARVLPDGDSAVKKVRESALKSVDSDVKERLEKDIENIINRKGRWYMLAELWDYIGGKG
jgi:thymidylate synthase ThyX